MLSYYAHLGARVLCGRSCLLGLCALLCPPTPPQTFFSCIFLSKVKNKKSYISNEVVRLDWNVIVLLWERALKHLEGKYKNKYFCVYLHCVIKHFRVNSAPGSQHDNDDGSHRGSFFFSCFCLFVCFLNVTVNLV